MPLLGDVIVAHSHLEAHCKTDFHSLDKAPGSHKEGVGVVEALHNHACVCPCAGLPSDHKRLP